MTGIKSQRIIRNDTFERQGSMDRVKFDISNLWKGGIKGQSEIKNKIYDRQALKVEVI